VPDNKLIGLDWIGLDRYTRSNSRSLILCNVKRFLAMLSLKFCLLSFLE